MIVDTAIYSDGKRTGAHSIEEARQACEKSEGFAWIGLFEPSPEEFESVSQEFDLHELAVEDTIKAHQRPKLERYGDSLFVVLRSARYEDESETVEFGEIHIFWDRTLSSPSGTERLRCSRTCAAGWKRNRSCSARVLPPCSTPSWTK